MRHRLVIPPVVLALAAGAAAQEPRERAVLKGHAEAAWHLAFSPDGTRLASCGEPTVKVWDVATGKEVATFESPGDDRWARAVAFAPDGKSLAFRWDGGTIQTWDPIGRGKPATIVPETGGGMALAYAPDGRVLAFSSSPAADSDGTGITLWDVGARKEFAVLAGHTRTITSLVVSPDNATLASASLDGTVRLWDLGTRKPRAVLEGHKGAVWVVVFHPDGKTAASGGEDGAIRSWDVATGDLKATLERPRARITALAFTPDGKTLASTSNDNRLRLWDTATWREWPEVKVPGEAVRGVVFTRDGRTMATGNADGNIRLWDMPLRDEGRAQGAPRREILKGTIAHSPEDHLRISGKARVIDGNTIAFNDGTEVDISGGMDAPPLGQLGMRDGALYPCGEEAAAFLRKLIGDKPVTCYVNTMYGMPRGPDRRLRGTCLIGETRVDEAMVLGGWAVSDHSSTNALELVAREDRRGLWRGKFVAPREWRKGARLPGEPPAPRPRPAAADRRAGQKPAAPSFVREGSRVVKIVGEVDVLDAHTLRFGDGALVELNGGMDAPELEQLAAVGDGLYPWGVQAADYLRALIRGRVVTRHVESGDCFIDETQLQLEMVRAGWAVSHHTGMDGWEMFAREGRRGVWRGPFVRPEDWRKGDRLPGEPGETTAQREALAALKAFDPIVTFDESKPGRPVVAIRFRPNTVEKVGDDDLARLKSFPNLRSLDVPSNPKVTDAGLEHLVRLNRLVELNLNGTGVTAAGVVKLVKGRRMMDRLEIAGVPFGDEDLAALRGLPYLRTLSLRATRITDAGLAQLRPFEGLRSLSLMSTGVGDAGLAHLEPLTSLEDLDLDRTAITDAGLVHLKALTNLRRLQVAHTAVTDAGLEHLRALPKLQDLNVRGTRVTEEAAEALRSRRP
jgi:endonuclease YncB( thermonuclease family)